MLVWVSFYVERTEIEARVTESYKICEPDKGVECSTMMGTREYLCYCANVSDEETRRTPPTLIVLLYTLKEDFWKPMD